MILHSGEDVGYLDHCSVMKVGRKTAHLFSSETKPHYDGFLAAQGRAGGACDSRNDTYLQNENSLQNQRIRGPGGGKTHGV